MNPNLMRKYADIIAEAGHTAIQLDEGMMDKIKAILPKAMKVLGGEALQDIANKVKSVTGGDYSLTADNAIKVAQALGFDKSQASTTQPVSEGLAGNWHGKIIQIAHLAGLAGIGAGMTATYGTPAMAFLGAVGLILLMITDTIWGDAPGQVGAMGKTDQTK